MQEWKMRESLMKHRSNVKGCNTARRESSVCINVANILCRTLYILTRIRRVSVILWRQDCSWLRRCCRRLQKWCCGGGCCWHVVHLVAGVRIGVHLWSKWMPLQTWQWQYPLSIFVHSRCFHSRIFHPWILYRPVFSTPAYSAPPLYSELARLRPVHPYPRGIEYRQCRSVFSVLLFGP